MWSTRSPDFLVTMLPMVALSWPAVALGFLLFRVLDVVKPWPARSLEKTARWLGHRVLDDVAAGIPGAGVVAGLRRANLLP
ncbi:MAG: phosphatidylglycerophosphatase A [Myxococcota bacterium]|nr:phosphatidylglycerophosphatase A [Myxococcota bacterium]